MTHYQTVFNGARMVYRKVVPKKGGAAAPPPTPAPEVQAPVVAAPMPRADTEAQKKQNRMKGGIELIRLL